MGQQTVNSMAPNPAGVLRAESYEKLRQILACPACRAPMDLAPNAPSLRCAACRQEYPIIGGVPVMLKDYSGSPETLDGNPPQSMKGLKQFPVIGPLLRGFLNPPGGLINVAAADNYRQLRQMLTGVANPRLLYVGGGSGLGVGSEQLGPNLLRSVINSDIFLFPTVHLVADGHHLPFVDESFDGVVIQSVLQHTAEPAVVVEEIRRLLRPGGVVYSEVPFLQRYYPDHDYQRFTREGVEFLFRSFEQVKSGMTNGPASSLAHVGAYALAALFSFRSEALYKLMLTIFRWLLAPVRHLDWWLKDHNHAREVASGFYFIGRKHEGARRI